MTFEDFNLSEYIVNALNEIGIVEPTPIQREAIPLIAEGKDVIGKSQTGSGKTFAFALPIIEKIDVANTNTQALIVCPTRELAAQVCDEMRKITSHREGVRVVPIFGGSDMNRQIAALKKGARIVVGTPGRLMDHLRRKTLRLKKVNTVVLDEADEMLDMGFKEDIETILKESNIDRQTVMFSATMPKPILAITEDYMREPVLVEIEDTDKNAMVEQFYVNVGLKDKTPALISMIKEQNPSIALVFCNTRKMVETLTKELQDAGINADGLHGEMRQSERKKVMQAIKSHEINVLVATDVAARGIDIHGVDIVYNYDIPQQAEYYTHRIGRTARAGATGVAYTLINTRNQLNELDRIHSATDNVICEYVTEYSVAHDTQPRVVGSRAKKAIERKEKDKTFAGRVNKNAKGKSNGKSYRDSGKAHRGNDKAYNDRSYKDNNRSRSKNKAKVYRDEEPTIGGEYSSKKRYGTDKPRYHGKSQSNTPVREKNKYKTSNHATPKGTVRYKSDKSKTNKSSKRK